MRKGVISAGNWIVDYVKEIEAYPKNGNLTTIVGKTTTALGGCSHNVLLDLAKMKTDLPLYAGGIIANDSAGELILNTLSEYLIDCRYMTCTHKASTSYTDVMAERGTGYRTFFHYRGTNALLDVDHIEKMETEAKLFHLGYLLLLDKLDAPDPEYGTVAARVLKILREKGYKTSVDMVSVSDPKVPAIISPSLPYIDYFIINEVETGECVGMEVRSSETNEINLDQLEKAARLLLDKGVNEVVIIHFPEGCLAVEKNGHKVFVPSFKVEKSEIVGTLGAGDAFCAGCLYGLHEGWAIEEVLRFGSANAWFNLHHATATGGQPPIEEIFEFISQHK